jgi:hypothetical protein
MTLAEPNHTDASAPRLDPERLRAANLHPETGLATDYLNRFNEAIMLLELVPDDPGCAEELAHWEPADYVQHFSRSSFKARDLAIEAYHRAPAVLRHRLNEIGTTMTDIIVQARAALAAGPAEDEARALVEAALADLKEYLSEASAVIHGKPLQEAASTRETQDGVDALFADPPAR